ncbi:MAG: GNAT family N-acetyltransferase [Cyanobacteria bacterium P01_D01_bin.6]
MTDAKLMFVPIDLDAAADLAITFRADAFVCSFGSDEHFYQADGKGHERYLGWLQHLMQSMPGSCVHVWQGEVIIGQIEMNRCKGEPEIAYINLFYLAPGYRNRGLGDCLDRYAMTYFAGLGLQTVRLSVSPTNRQAMKFYRKNGWHDLGPQPGHPEVHLMQKEIEP